MISDRIVSGFLVTNGTDMGIAIELLRQYAREIEAPYVRDLAERLNAISVASYHQRLEEANHA